MNFKTLILPLLLGLGLVLAACFYFKPIVFDGKSLPEHDNQQSRAMQTEIHQYYKENPNHTILWTNQLFVGMPTYQLLGSQNNNIPYKVVENAVYLRQDILSPPVLLSMLMLMAFAALLLLGVDALLAFFGALSFGFITNNLILMEAGHSTKLHTLVYVLPLMATAWQIFRGRLWLAGGLFAFFLAVHIRAYHVQITYYTFMSLGLLTLFEGIYSLKQKTLGRFFKGAMVLALASAIGVMANTTMLWTTAEYTAESIRGRSELSQKAAQNGLDKDYIFNWSLGKMESMALIFPNFYGGGSSHKERPAWVSDKNSATTKAFRQLAASGQVPNEQLNSLARLTAAYWGPQPFTAGPIYYGLVLFLLGVLGFLSLRGPLRWWLGGTIFFFLVLAWGQYFPGFNNLMVDYFPMYNKFRAVTMTMTVAQAPLVLLAVLGLKAIKDAVEGKAELGLGLTAEKLVVRAGAVVLGLCVLVYLYPSIGDMSGKYDGEMLKFPAYAPIVDAMEEDRAAAMRADAFRGILFTVLALAPLWFFTRKKLNWALTILVVGAISLADQISVGRDYVNAKSFVSKRETRDVPPPSPASQQILADKEPHFRVLDLTQPDGAFNSATPCFYHKNVGGYNAAKPMLYQELREAYFDSENLFSAHLHVLEMLNVKYIIQSPERPIKTENLGNAWLPETVQFVPNADEELKALGGFDPRKTAIVQARYKAQLEGLAAPAEGDNIRLTGYHPERLTYEYQTQGERLAVFSEIYYPTEKGWNIYIDDALVDQSILKVNYLLRGIRLPAGKHKLEMRFEPRSFYTGEWITLSGSFLALLFLAWGIWMYRRETQQEAAKPAV